MHSDPGLVARLFDILPDELVPKKMFGGQSWLLNGNFCLGVYKEFLIVRIGVQAFDDISNENGVSPMDITGSSMKGWAKIDHVGTAEDEDLQKYINLALNFVKTLPAK